MTRTSERWVYTGRRLGGRTRKVFGVWLDPNDKELWYAERTVYAIGGVYDVEVTRTDEGTTRHGDPKFTGERASDERLVVWQSEDAAAYAASRVLATEAKLKREKVDLLTPAAVRALKACRTPDQVDAILAAIRREAWAAWR